MAYFHCCGTSPHVQIPTTILSNLSQNGITFESYLEQFDGNSIRSNRLLVGQRANDICQPLHCGLDSQRCVYGPLVEIFGNVRAERR